ncbi:HEAT repeat domain-containing protein [bacterium]|nr:HEAT repeat domain-containing protein [bacterium]
MIVALISILPLYPILPLKRETNLLKLIKHFYWYLFWLIAFLAKPFLFLFSMPKEELNFYTSFYRSLLGPVLKDERAVILIRPYLKKYSTRYQFILLRHPIVYDTKPMYELVEDLKEIFCNAPSHDDKWAVANILTRLASDKALQLFAEFIEKSNSVETKEVALNAFLLLKESLDDNCIHVIQQSLKSEPPALRAMACFVLGSLRNKDELHILHQLTHDENFDVKSSACRALSRIGSPESIHFLKNLLSDTDEEIRDIAYDALWQICRQNSVKLTQNQIS